MISLLYIILITSRENSRLSGNHQNAEILAFLAQPQPTTAARIFFFVMGKIGIRNEINAYVTEEGIWWKKKPILKYVYFSKSVASFRKPFPWTFPDCFNFMLTSFMWSQHTFWMMIDIRPSKWSILLVQYHKTWSYYCPISCSHRYVNFIMMQVKQIIGCLQQKANPVLKCPGRCSKTRRLILFCLKWQKAHCALIILVRASGWPQ